VDRGAVTWAGSVAFGAGSEDPPPNRVEMVLPSSETQLMLKFYPCSRT